MAIVRGSSAQFTVRHTGDNLTDATEILMTFANVPQGPVKVSKSLTAAQITVTYADDVSELTLTLSDTDTLLLDAGKVYYQIHVSDGTPGGFWVPDNGGDGVINMKAGMARP